MIHKYMVKNRKIALWYRIIAFVVSVVGVIFAVEIFHKGFNPTSLLYYTLQSNILVCIWFGVLTIKTMRVYIKNGKSGPCEFYPRASATVLFSIMVTFVIFWTLLAPIIPKAEMLLNPMSLGVHFITPLLMLADYIMFSTAGKLKKRDIAWFVAVPLIYFIQAMILGLCGVMYSTAHSPKLYHFPYPFMDYTIIGWWMMLSIPLIIVLLVAGGYLFLYLDKRRIKKQEMHTIKNEKN